MKWKMSELKEDLRGKIEGSPEYKDDLIRRGVSAVFAGDLTAPVLEECKNLLGMDIEQEIGKVAHLLPKIRI